MTFTQKEGKPPVITDNAESPSNNNHQVRAETPTENKMISLLHEICFKTFLPKGLLIQYLKSMASNRKRLTLLNYLPTSSRSADMKISKLIAGDVEDEEATRMVKEYKPESEKGEDMPVWMGILTLISMVVICAAMVEATKKSRSRR
jgi:hypothetical protein